MNPFGLEFLVLGDVEYILSRRLALWMVKVAVN